MTSPRALDRPPVRYLLFVAGLAVALVAGFGIGRAVGPTGATDPATGAVAAGHGADGHSHAHPMPAGGPAAGTEVGGLAVSAGGYTLVPESTDFTAGREAPLRFRITGPDGAAVTDFAVVHDKRMHLIIVRRDLSGFQHLHPELAADGTWEIPLTLPEPGIWRAYADFSVVTAAGAQQAATLGVDLTVTGDYRPAELPPPATEATVAGFRAAYEGEPTVGATQPLLFQVTTAGGAPATLEPYLGAYGHLVVLREGDLGYVHVHPEQQLVDGKVKFWLAAPSPGRYRMYLDFQVGGAVHTAGYTLVVS